MSNDPQGRGRPTLLTEDLKERLLKMIREGTFPWVAAVAVNIAPGTFREWMARGESRDPDRPADPLYVSFATQVRQAQAEARADKEMEIYKDNPLAWLKAAAKTAELEPGWTDAHQVELSGEVAITVDSEIEAVLEKIVQAERAKDLPSGPVEGA